MQIASNTTCILGHNPMSHYMDSGGFHIKYLSEERNNCVFFQVCRLIQRYAVLIYYINITMTKINLKINKVLVRNQNSHHKSD